MSRIGKAPIPVPGGRRRPDRRPARSRSRAPRAQLSRSIPERVTVRQDGDTLLVERPDDERESRALHGLVRSLVTNMVIGVTDGFRKELDIVGVGYRAAAKGSDDARAGARASRTPSWSRPPRASSSSCPSPPASRCTASTSSSSARWPPTSGRWRKPEPYKGKGVRYVDEHVRRKAGKAGK